VGQSCPFNCECLGMEFRIGGHASVEFRVGGHARWLWPPIAVDKSISARTVLARGSTFGGSVVIWRSRKRLCFYGYGSVHQAKYAHTPARTTGLIRPNSGLYTEPHMPVHRPVHQGNYARYPDRTLSQLRPHTAPYNEAITPLLGPVHRACYGRTPAHTPGR
jgi:hypothetical protein